MGDGGANVVVSFTMPTAAFLTSPLAVPRDLPAAILTTGIIAGVLDAFGAIAHYSYNGGRDPTRIFRYVASAVFGPSALSGGEPMVMAGVLFHMLIAIAWSAGYFLLAARIPLLRERVLPCAVLYGACVWIVMNRVVIPLSRITPSTNPLDPTQTVVAVGVLIICIALPNAIRAHRFYAARARTLAT